MNDLYQRIHDYYSLKESRYGYHYLMDDAKHFGFYPDVLNKKNFSERDAKIFYQDLVAKKLDLREGQEVLDAGCGRGVTACYLAPKYKVKITGLDCLGFELDIARCKAKDLKLSNCLNFQLGDYSETEFPDQNFDAIYANETLSHSPNIPKVFSEFYRILKYSGKIVLFEYFLAPEKDFSEKQRKDLNFIIEESGMAGLKDFRQENIKQNLIKQGFRNVILEDVTKNIMPSFLRLHKLAIIVTPLVRLFKLEKHFINAISADVLYPMAEQGLIKFIIVTAQKSLE